MNSIINLVAKVRTNAFFGEFVFFAFSTLTLQTSKFGVNIFAARILGPETWGLWYMLNLLLAYSGLIHFGVINAMNRDVPISRGKTDLDRVRLIQSVTFGVMLITTILAVIAVTIWALFWSEEALSISLLALAILLTVTQFYIFLQTYLKSDGQFKQMSQQQLVFALLFPVFTVPLTLNFGLSGFILGQAIVTAIVSIYLVRTWTFNLRPIFNFIETLRLVRVGTPIMLVGLLYTLLTTADRWVITALLDIEQLGYYSIAIMSLGILSLIPSVLAQQMYPRMAEVWGKTGSSSEVFKWAIRQVIMAAAITLPMLIAVYLIAPPLVSHFLPAYESGIPALKAILLGPLFLSLSGGFANLLNTLNKQVYYLGVQAFALAINIGLNLLLVRVGLGITGVAIGTSLTFGFYSLALILISVKVTLPRRKELAV